LLWLLVVTPWHVARLSRLIRRARPDVVYVNTVTLPHWVVAAKVAGVPVLCHVREAEHDMRPWMARLLLAPLRSAAVVVANSAATAQWLSGHQSRLADKVRVVYNGFAFPEATGRDDGEPGRIVVVGRLSPRKGQDVAIEAVARLAAAGRDVHLDLVGDVFRGYEWYEAELLRQIEERGLAGRAALLGFRADPTECYRAASIVVVPSRVEPFGNVAVEAMAAGRAVVATDVGGLPEIVDDGRTGLLCPPDDAAALAAAITRLLDDSAFARRVAQAGAASVRMRFGMARFAAELRDAVDTAAAARRDR
jgi:glycosyltransferase involved in cell wall biosynthesis